jgi:hypothetical protein
MKFDSPADLIEKVQRNSKAFTAAETSGDLKTALRLTEECVALFNQLAKKVPLREMYYREQAKVWKIKAEKITGALIAEQNAYPDMIGDEVVTTMDTEVVVKQVSKDTAPSKPPPIIFISYSKPDQQIAKDLCTHLEAENIPCWIAPRDVLPGSIFLGSIFDAIDACIVMVVVFSKSSDNSPHVLRELARAVTRNILIIPFRIEEILPSKNMDYLINIPHWFDAFPPPAQQYFGTLTQTIKTHLAGLQTVETKPDNSGR